jgi:zinc/manganese transport system substrate-binding protein
MSPATMIEMLPELADELGAVLGTDLSASLAAVTADLTALDAEVAAIMSGVKKCEFVTGHDEMGYFAGRYGCELIGAIIPSTTTTAEASAGELAKLKEVILEHGTKVVFVTLGTPRAVAAQIAKETGASLVELPTDSMGTATSYAEFMKSIANRIADALK